MPDRSVSFPEAKGEEGFKKSKQTLSRVIENDDGGPWAFTGGRVKSGRREAQRGKLGRTNGIGVWLLFL